jgi:hypothetical protein
VDAKIATRLVPKINKLYVPEGENIHVDFNAYMALSADWQAKKCGIAAKKFMIDVFGLQLSEIPPSKFLETLPNERALKNRSITMTWFNYVLMDFTMLLRNVYSAPKQNKSADRSRRGIALEVWLEKTSIFKTTVTEALIRSLQLSQVANTALLVRNSVSSLLLLLLFFLKKKPAHADHSQHYEKSFQPLPKKRGKYIHHPEPSSPSSISNSPLTIHTNPTNLKKRGRSDEAGGSIENDSQPSFEDDDASSSSSSLNLHPSLVSRFSMVPSDALRASPNTTITSPLPPTKMVKLRDDEVDEPNAADSKL